MKVQKIGYYLSSLLTLLRVTKNPLILLLVPFKKKVLLSLNNGLKLYVQSPLDCLIFKETIFDDAYKVTKLQSPQIIIDIGAGLGDFALFASQCFPQATIIAFEPNPSYFLLLQTNIKINKYKNVTAFPLGIGSKKNMQTLQIYKEFAKGSLFPKLDKPVKKSVQISIEPLEKYLNKTIDLIKIDCEGAEMDILYHLPSAKFRKIKKIALEYHKHIRSTMEIDLQKLLHVHDFTLTIKPDKFDTNIGYLYAEKT